MNTGEYDFIEEQDLMNICGTKLGNNLKLIRNHFGLSQNELAEKIKVTRQAISKWENNIDFPDINTLLIVKRKLGITLDDLFEMEEAELLAVLTQRGITH